MSVERIDFWLVKFGKQSCVLRWKKSWREKVFSSKSFLFVNLSKLGPINDGIFVRKRKPLINIFNFSPKVILMNNHVTMPFVKQAKKIAKKKIAKISWWGYRGVLFWMQNAAVCTHYASPKKCELANHCHRSGMLV